MFIKFVNGFIFNNILEIINLEVFNIKCLVKWEIIMILIDYFVLIWNIVFEDKMLFLIFVMSIKLLFYEKVRKLGLNL